MYIEDDLSHGSIINQNCKITREVYVKQQSLSIIVRVYCTKKCELYLSILIRDV